jgi:hypothetical protein
VSRRALLLLPGPAALLALCFGVQLGLSPLKHYDLFFHLAGGRYVLEHGFNQVDPFSVTGTAGWVPHEWGFGVLSVLLVKVLGAAGPALLTGALVAANVLLLWAALGRAVARRGLVALGVLALVLGVQSSTWSQERPFHVGHLLFTLAVLGTQAWRSGKDKVLWWAPVLGAAWANLHGSWLLGPALLGATAVGHALDAPEQRPRAFRALGASVAMFLASALSPSGPSIWLYPLHHSALKSTQNINEWVPLDLAVGWSWAYLALVGAALFFVGQASERRAAILLPALGLGLAALKVQRHAPFAAVLVALALMEHLAPMRGLLWPELVRRPVRALDETLARWSASTGGSLWPALALLVLAGVAWRYPVPVEQGVLRSRFPLSCFQALRQLPPGKVLNRFTIGGAISYFAGADYKVFIDSRNDPFPQPIHDDYTHLLWSEPGWEEALARYDPDYLLWDEENPGNILLDQLRQRGGWREVTRDSGYVLWVRTRSSTR